MLSAQARFGKFANCDQKCDVTSIACRAVRGQVQAEGRWGGVLQGGSAAAVSCHCKLRIVVVAVVYILAALRAPPSGRGPKQLPGLPVSNRRPWMRHQTL